MVGGKGNGKGEGEQETPQGPAAALAEVGGGGEVPDDDATPVMMGGGEETLKVKGAKQPPSKVDLPEKRNQSSWLTWEEGMHMGLKHLQV